MSHARWCPVKAFQHSDAAKRLSDTYNLHRMGDIYGAIGKWFAVRLADGTSDNVLYDRKLEAIRHQHHNEQHYAYIKVVPTTMTPCEAEVYLQKNREFYERGFRMVDPDSRTGGPEVIKRLSIEDELASSYGFVTNVEMPPELLGRMN